MKVKTRTSLLIALVVSLLICLTGLTYALSQNTQALATDTAYTVTNIEDLLDDPSELKIYQDSNERPFATYGNKVSGVVGDNTAWGVFTKKADDSSIVAYTPSVGNGLDENGNLNINEYAGNISFTTASGFGSQGLYFDAGENNLVSFRTNLNTAQQKGFAVGKSQVTKGCDKTEGYWFDLQYNSTQKRYILYAYIGGQSTRWALYGAGQSGSPTITPVDSAIFTMGTYVDADGLTHVVFKVFNETTQKYVIEMDKIDTDKLGVRHDAESTKYYVGVFSTWWTRTTDFAGINHPIFNDFSEDIVIEQPCKVGTNKADVVIDTHYNFADNEGTIAMGPNQLEGTINYYGKLVDVTAIVMGYSNIEDVVDSTSDFTYDVGGQFYSDYNQVVSGKASAEYDVAIYTDAKTTDTEATNANEYKGNISLYSSAKQIQGIWLKGMDWNAIIKVRVPYEAGRYYSFTARKSEYAAGKWVSAAEGYEFQLNCNGIMCLGKHISGVSPSVTEFTDTSYTNGTLAVLGSITGITEGEMLDITYGVYDVVVGGVTKTYYYYNVVSSNGGFSHTMSGEDTTALTKPAKRFQSNDKNYMQIVPLRHGNLHKQETMVPISIRGIDQPILNSVYDIEAEGTAGAKASTLSLPSGYSIKNGDAVLAAGENVLDASFAIDSYNGSATAIDCKVTVNIAASTVTLLAEDGTTVLEESLVATNSAYTLPVKEVSGKVFIGWKTATGEVYPAGYALTISENTTLTLINATFAFAGASVRMSNNESGFGGLRFAIKIDTPDVLGDVDWYGMILPKDMLVDDMFNADDIETAQANDSLVKVTSTTTFKDGSVGAIFTLLDIKQTNYNRDFACVAYMEIEYADGSTAKIFTDFDVEDDVRSVYDVANAAVSDPLNQFGASELAVLNAYIDSVVELNASYEKVGNGNYTVASQVEGSVLTITLTTSVQYQASGDGLIHVPVIINGVRYASVATAVTGGYTLTINIA